MGAGAAARRRRSVLRAEFASLSYTTSCVERSAEEHRKHSRRSVTRTLKRTCIKV